MKQTYSFRADKTLIKWLIKTAKEENVSVSELIRIIIGHWAISKDSPIYEKD